MKKAARRPALENEIRGAVVIDELPDVATFHSERTKAAQELVFPIDGVADRHATRAAL